MVIQDLTLEIEKPQTSGDLRKTSSILFVYHFFTEDSIFLYCTEYSITLLLHGGIFRYHVKAWTRFSGLDLTSVGGLELPIKGGYIFM